MTKDIVPAIKQRLTLPLPGKYMQMQMAPTFRPDINNQQTSVKAGVMILLYPNPTELYVVLMKKANSHRFWCYAQPANYACRLLMILIAMLNTLLH